MFRYVENVMNLDTLSHSGMLRASLVMGYERARSNEVEKERRNGRLATRSPEVGKDQSACVALFVISLLAVSSLLPFLLYIKYLWDLLPSICQTPATNVIIILVLIFLGRSE